MTDPQQQLREVCEWNKKLARENAVLRVRTRNCELEVRELQTANANLRVEREAVETVLGAAVDEALKARRP